MPAGRGERDESRRLRAGRLRAGGPDRVRGGRAARGRRCPASPNGSAAERGKPAGPRRRPLPAGPDARPGLPRRPPPAGGAARFGAGRFPAAEQHYAAALAARPHDADLLCDSGYSFLLQNRLPEAEDRLRTALSKTPDHTRSLENLALLAARRGDRAAAESALAATNAPGVSEKLALLFPETPTPAGRRPRRGRTPPFRPVTCRTRRRSAWRRRPI